MLRIKKSSRIINNTNNNCRAQSLVEYAIVIGVIGLVIMAMGPMIQRMTQSMIKMTADQIGNQENSEQDFYDLEAGHMIYTTAKIESDIGQTTREILGNTTYYPDETVTTKQMVSMNLGYIEKADR